MFNDGVNVLLGRNGTGKTTLLELIATVVGSRFESLRHEPLSIEYELLLGNVRMAVTLQSRGGPKEFAARGARRNGAGRGSTDPEWSFRVEVETDEVTLRVSGTPAGARLERDGVVSDVPTVVPFEWYFPAFALDLAMVGDAASIGSVVSEEGIDCLYRQLNTIRFDEGLDAFRRMTGPDATWIVLTDTGGTVDLFSPGYCPASLLFTLRSKLFERATPSPIQNLPDSEVPFLKDAVALLEFEGARLEGRLLQKEASAEGLRWSFGNPIYSFTTDSQGSVIQHDYLSYGQKRLFAFLYYLEANPDIIVADELVNGMHYEWIEACLRKIEGRQAFLTSQNPLLLDFLPFESAEQVQRSFIQCRRRTGRDGGMGIDWKNMSAEDARSFYGAYEVGIQQVGEILRTRGLW